MKTTQNLKIRIAKVEDAETLLAIYAPYVEQTAITYEYEVPTLERLKKAGAENIHVSVTDHVIDTSGSYFLDENGRATKQNTGIPYQYSGHWSWIYFFNNECSADGLTAWDFISDCLK